MKIIDVACFLCWIATAVAQVFLLKENIEIMLLLKKKRREGAKKMLKQEKIRKMEEDLGIAFTHPDAEQWVKDYLQLCESDK